jgi:exopolysaccharide production protein ExoQ
MTAQDGALLSAREAARHADRAASMRGGTTSEIAAGPVIWALCFVSFLGLQSIQFVGTLGVIGFLAPWAFILAPRFPSFVGWLIRDRLMLALPILATMSTLWSTNPSGSLRAGLEYGATVCIGIAAARCVSRRAILTSLMVAQAILTAASLLAARVPGTFGLFGSKNQLAAFAAMQLIISASYALSSKETWLFRGFAAVLAVEAFLGFVIGRSAGALVALLSAVAFVLSLRIEVGRRTWLYIVSLPLVLCGVVMISDIGWDTITIAGLQGLGKDATLTGRTDLWLAGWEQIREHFLLGTGYKAFWTPGNPVAERIWTQFGIFGKTGFHFHSTFVNTGVDLGIFGVFVLVVVLGLSIARDLTKFIGNKSPEETMTEMLFAFSFILMFVEEEFVDQFYVTTILLCLYWGLAKNDV